MLRTDIAALPGCEITKNTRSTTVSVPRIFLPFIKTTVHGFGTTRAGLVLPDRGGVTESITHTGSQLIMTERDGSVPCVGGLAYDDEGRLLVVRRANEPGRGLWSIPGGRVEPGEDDAAALVREMREETGLDVAPGPLVGTVQRGRYAIADYRCTVVGGTLRPGDDALDARFVDRAALGSLSLVPELLVTLEDWSALPER
jgi:ADP-ribose pyrophosphatase YjhB (NUDIX family)